VPVNALVPAAHSRAASEALSMSDEALLMQYLREASSWDGDRVAQAQRSARRAWALSGAAALIAALAVSAVALLTPLKRVEPFLIRSTIHRHRRCGAHFCRASDHA